MIDQVEELFRKHPRPKFSGWHRLSLAERVALMGAEFWQQLMALLSATAVLLLLRSWLFLARPAQMPPPGNWLTWVIQAGRGFGKTWTGANWVNEMARKNPGGTGAIVGRSWKDVRQTMVEGPSGILKTAQPDFRPIWKPNLGELRYPNGCVVYCYAATEPDQLRGPNLAFAWCDEYAAWAYPWEAIENLWDTLRGCDEPRCLVTTTPRAHKAMTDLLAKASTVVTHGSSLDNAANLPASYLRDRAAARGTARYDQEFLGKLVAFVAGALWAQSDFERPGFRAGASVDDWAASKGAKRTLKNTPMPPGVEKVRVVVGVDPQAVHGVGCTGIVVVALGSDGHGYVLRDASDDLTPDGWAQLVWEVHEAEQADLIVWDTQHGGDLVENNLRQWCKANGRRMPLVKKSDAKRGKATRVQPYVAMYRAPEGPQIHHVAGLDELEQEQRTWVPGEDPKYSPHRVDALGYCLQELFPAMDGEPAPAGGRVDTTQATGKKSGGSYAPERKSRWQNAQPEADGPRLRPVACRPSGAAPGAGGPREPAPAWRQVGGPRLAA